MRLPDHPESQELSEEWNVVATPFDGPPPQVTGGPGVYVHTQFGGSRDRDSMLEARLADPLVQFTGPNAVAPRPIRISPRYLAPPLGNPSRRLIEARFRCKVRTSPWSSAVDDPSAASIVPGTVGPSASGPWGDELTITAGPGATTAATSIYFKSPPGNWDHHVEITAEVTLEEVINGNPVRWDQGTTLMLRAGYMRPRLNFVRKSGSDWVAILEESVRPAELQDAAGNPVPPRPDDEFRLELLGQDLGPTVTASILAGERVDGIELSRVETTPAFARYRSGACYLYTHQLTSGEPRPAAPPGVTLIPAGSVEQINGQMRDGMPGNTGSPPVEYRTGKRPLTRFDLVELGDAEEDLKVPAPIIELLTPETCELPATVSAGQILVTVSGHVYDALSDLGGAPPTKVEIDGRTYPLVPVVVPKTGARPSAWQGRFDADVPAALGTSHLELLVSNSAGQVAERTLRVHLTELDNRRSAPQRVRAEAWPFVPGQPIRLPMLRAVHAACTPVTGAPAVLPVTLSAMDPFPGTAVSAQVVLQAPAQQCLSPVYQTAVFLVVRDDAVSPTTSLPPNTMRLSDGGRIEWRADLPNALGSLPLAGRTAPLTETVSIQRWGATGQWEPATFIGRGDRIRVVGRRAISQGGDRLETTLDFVDPNGQTVAGPERGLFVILQRVAGTPDFELGAWLNGQFQEEPALEVVVRADGEPAPPNVPVLRLQRSGFVRTPHGQVPAAVRPSRHQRNGVPVPQELPGTGAVRIGPGRPCVIPGTGEVVVAAEDLEIPSRGLPFEIGRTWRSGTDYPGTLGWGWSATWDESAWRMQDGASTWIMLFDQHGHLLRFEKNAMGQWDSPPGCYAALSEAGGGFRLELPGGGERRYLGSGPGEQGLLVLVSEEDRFGNMERWIHPSHGRPALVTDPLDRSLQLRSDAARGTVEALGDWTGRDLEFDVAAAADADGGAHTLREVRSPLTEHAAGETPVRRRVIYRWYPPAGRNDLRGINDPVSEASGLTDLQRFSWKADGEAETVRFDAATWGFTVAGNRFEWADSLGRLRVMTLSPHGPPGYAPLPEVLEERLGARVLRTTFGYNPEGELTRKVSPRGGVTDWVFDHTATDPRARGNLLSCTHTPAPGYQATVQAGPVQYDPAAPFTATPVATLRTQATFDPAWQELTTFVDAAGRTMTRQIVDGTPTEQHLPTLTTPNGPLPRVITRTWNRWGQQLTEVDPNGVVRRFAYYPPDDPAGLLPSSVPVSDPDKPGGLLATVVADTSAPGVVRAAHLAPPRPITTRFTYDALGRMVSATVGSMGASRWSHNATGEVLSTVRPDGATLSLKLDRNGRTLEESTEVTDIGFPADLPAAPPRTERHTYEYSRSGQTAEQVVDADGLKLKTTWHFDGAGRVEYERRPRYHDAAAPRPHAMVHYEYDDLDRVIRTIVAKDSPQGESVTQSEYDDDGNILDEWHPGGSAGRLNGSTYEWDGFGRCIAVSDRNGNRTVSGHDATGRITVRRRTGSVRGEAVATPASAPTLVEERMFYDEGGNLVAHLERAFVPQPSATGGWTEQPIGSGARANLSLWDAAGLELSVSTDPPTVIATRGYDGHGLKVMETTGFGEKAAYQLDDAGRVVQAVTTNPRGIVTIDLRRDGAGRLLEQQVNNVSISQSRYDSVGRIRLQLDAYGNPTETIWDAAGRRVTSVSRLYQGGQRILPGGTVAPIQATEYHRKVFDAESHLLSATNPSGAIVERLEYDDRGFVVRRELPEDAFDLTVPDGAGGTRLIQRDDYPGVSAWTYTWTADGQPLRTTDPDGHWVEAVYDDSGRLTERRAGEDAGVTPRAGSRVQTYRWDGAGRLVEGVDDNGIASRGISFQQTYTSLNGIIQLDHSENVTPVLPRNGSGRVTSTFRPDGSLASVVWPWGLTVEHRLDAVGRVDSVFDLSNGEEVVRYQWD
ncbi:MAG TPA: DUF6531 domain-containing protein, partial [Gemmatimonadales bacterium]|nr:DUF6531 domain-containing protein [Gemmatimonadales bacterium]